MKTILLILAVLAIAGIGLAVCNMGKAVATKAASQSATWENLK